MVLKLAPMNLLKCDISYDRSRGQEVVEIGTIPMALQGEVIIAPLSKAGPELIGQGKRG